MKVRFVIDMEIEGSKETKKSLIKKIQEQIVGERFLASENNGVCGLHDCRGFDKNETPYWAKTLRVKVKKKR